MLPIDTTGGWGWPPQADRQQWARYWWSAGFDGMDGPVGMRFTVLQSDSAGRSFSSLESFHAAGAAALSLGHNQDTGNKIVTTVQGNRIILTLRDSVTIRRTFGTRPRMATLSFADPDGGRQSYRPDSAPIRYVDPQIPEPDSATLAEASRGRRLFESRISQISREITGGPGYHRSLWLAVGDSVTLTVAEHHCHYDTCGMAYWPVSDSGWSVGDSTILGLRSSCGGLNAPGAPGCVTVRGIRLGRTSVTVRGLRSAADTMPSMTPPERALTRLVTIGKPVVRVRLTRRIDSVMVGDTVRFSAAAYDQAGHVIPEVPVMVRVDMGTHGRLMEGERPQAVSFDREGVRSVVASFNGMQDSLLVRVIPKR